MVVINTKKIFITILVSALLLVGSALTVFAFDFSAPNYNDSDIFFQNYESTAYLMYNYINIDGDEQRYFQYVGSFMAFYDYETEETTKRFVLTLSKYGFDFLSQNGANAQSMKSVLDDFIDGNVGNITVLWGRFSPVNYYLFDDGVSILSSDYQDTPQYFDVISDLNNQFFNYESQYNTLNSQLISLQSQYNSLLSQYTHLLKDYQNLQTINSDLQTAFQELSNEYNTLHSQYGDLRAQYDSLETQYNDLFNSYNDLTDYYSKELTRLLNENNDLRSSLQKADIQINTLEGEILRLKDVVAQEYMKGYTQAFEDYDLFEDGLYSIFSAPFTIVYELSEIEVFGFSIVRIVGIILLFVVLSFILAFIWKVIPLL